jgi:hypothetical protein
MFDHYNSPFSKFYNSPSGLWTFALNFVSGGALLVAAAWFSYNQFSARSDLEAPVRTINSVAIDPTIMLAGKTFTVRVNVTLNKLCPYEVHWSLARKTDGVEVVKIIEPVRQPPDKLGQQDLPPFTRYIPQTVEPGEYRYIAEVIDRCPGSQAVTASRHDQVITVR